MTALEQLEQKIRQSIPELKEEFEVFQEGAIDADMITHIGLNHVLVYWQDIDLVRINCFGGFEIDEEDSINTYFISHYWNLKSPYLKDQSEELINFLNELE